MSQQRDELRGDATAPSLPARARARHHEVGFDRMADRLVGEDAHKLPARARSSCGPPPDTRRLQESRPPSCAPRFSPWLFRRLHVAEQAIPGRRCTPTDLGAALDVAAGLLRDRDDCETRDGPSASRPSPRRSSRCPSPRTLRHTRTSPTLDRCRTLHARSDSSSRSTSSKLFLERPVRRARRSRRTSKRPRASCVDAGSLHLCASCAAGGGGHAPHREPSSIALRHGFRLRRVRRTRQSPTFRRSRTRTPIAGVLGDACDLSPRGPSRRPRTASVCRW